jgi:hypothetical protein
MEDSEAMALERAREAASRVEISDWMELRRVVVREREVPKVVRARVSFSMVLGLVVVARLGLFAVVPVLTGLKNEVSQKNGIFTDLHYIKLVGKYSK